MSDRWLPLGDAVEAVYSESVQDWLRWNRRGMETEVALTSAVRLVTLEVTLRPGRHGLAIVSLHGRRANDTDTYAAEVLATPLSALRALRM